MKKSQKVSRAMAKKFFEDEGEIVVDASDREKYLSSNISAIYHFFLLFLSKILIIPSKVRVGNISLK